MLKRRAALTLEYKVWKKQSPFLYDVLLTRALEYPSLTVDWLPDVAHGGYFDTWTLLLGTHTSQNDRDYLMTAKVDLPKSSYNGEDGELVNRISIAQRMDHEGEVNRARHMPQDSTIVATLAPSGDALIFDRADLPSESTDNKPLPKYRLKHHTKEGWGLAWSPLRKGWLATGAEDQTAAVWDINSETPEKPVYVFKDHDAIVNDVAWSQTRSYLVGSVSDDQAISLYDVRDGKPIATVPEAHSAGINGIHFNYKHDNLFATASSDDTVGVWDLRRLSTPLASLRGHASDVSQVMWSPHDASVLASAGYDRRLLIWDLARVGEEQTADEEQEGPPELVFIHGGHTNKISDFSWHPEMPWTLATASEDNIVQVWKVSGSIVDREEEQEEDAEEAADEEEQDAMEEENQ